MLIYNSLNLVVSPSYWEIIITNKSHNGTSLRGGR